MCWVGVKQRVGRVLSFFSSRRNWNSLTPLSRKRLWPLPFGPGGRGTFVGERGVGRVPIPTSLCICILHMFVYTVCLHVIPHRYLQSCTVSHGSTAVLKKVSIFRNNGYSIDCMWWMHGYLLNKAKAQNHHNWPIICRILDKLAAWL